MPYKKGERKLEYREYKDTCPTLTENCASGDQKNIVVHNMQQRSGDPKKGGTGHLTKENGSAYCLDGGRTNAIEFKGMKIRRLTPIECERLQGFPDEWTRLGLDDTQYKKEGGLIIRISDTQRYKALGNAVTTNVITEIGKGLNL